MKPFRGKRGEHLFEKAIGIRDGGIRVELKNHCISAGEEIPTQTIGLILIGKEKLSAEWQLLLKRTVAKELLFPARGRRNTVQHSLNKSM